MIHNKKYTTLIQPLLELGAFLSFPFPDTFSDSFLSLLSDSFLSLLSDSFLSLELGPLFPAPGSESTLLGSSWVGRYAPLLWVGRCALLSLLCRTFTGCRKACISGTLSWWPYAPVRGPASSCALEPWAGLLFASGRSSCVCSWSCAVGLLVRCWGRDTWLFPVTWSAEDTWSPCCVEVELERGATRSGCRSRFKSAASLK